MATALNDRGRLGLASIAVANDHRIAGEYEQSIAANERAASIGRALGDTPLVVVATHQIAMTHRDRGDLRQALEGFRSSVEPLASLTVADRRRLGLTSANISLARAYLARMLASLGELREALVRGRESIEMAEASGEFYGVTVATNIFGAICCDLGDVAQAIPFLERGRTLSRERNLPNPLVLGTAELGAAYVIDGQPLTGIPLLEEALALSASTGVIQAYARSLVWLGEAYLAVGRLGDAGDMARTALDYAVEQRELHHQAYALRLLGDVAAVGATPSVEAEARYREALALAESLEMRPLQAHCHLRLGKLCRRVGRLDDARAHLGTATSLLREMEMTRWLPDAEAERSAVTRQLSGVSRQDPPSPVP